MAAVLMARVAGPAAARAEGASPVRARRNEWLRAVPASVARGGGRMVPSAGEALLAEFQSAVEAMRCAVEVQETLRARNKSLPPEERLDTRLAITIGDVVGGEEVAPETLSDVTRLVARAAPGGVCISESVREAVASKLALKFQEVSVEADAAHDEAPATYRVAAERRPPPARSPLAIFARTAAKTFAPLGAPAALPRSVLGLAGGIAAAFALLVFGLPGPSPPPPPAAGPQASPALTPAASGPTVHAPAATKPAPVGKIEFMPGHAPDPAVVLTARRLLPNAWRDCQDARPDVAVAGCKTLLDSGIAKGAELAEVHLWNGKALRERNELDKALEELDAAIALSPSAQAYSLRGTVHHDKASWEKAIADYTEAIRLDSGNGEAWNNRAWTYYRSGRADKALADADQAVRLLAKEAYVWDTRAHIHARLGNREAAIRDFRAALAIDPKSATSKAGLASLGVN